MMNKFKKGHLKIFFSYAENIGKTSSMVKAALTARAQGIDVVIGYIAMHALEEDPQLKNLVGQLEQLSTKDHSFSIDQALHRHPDLIVIDELAHSNSSECRHRKRYQEVIELLSHGIDVYTTVNVSNLESLHDTVASITGITTWNRIPDSIFDDADQVELIDIEPQELIERLREKNTADSQLTVEQLTALREIALRRCADRVKRFSSQLSKNHHFYTDEHILACLSSAPSNAKIIRTAARMARAFNSQFTALFVETPGFASETKENKERLQNHIKLAEQLGANIETVYGEDVPYQIAEYARLSNITKIVLGRSAITRKHLFCKPTLTEQLLSYDPEMDIHIIPDRCAETNYFKYKNKPFEKNSIFINTLKSCAILSGSTLLSILFDRLGFTNANIIMVYILGVLLTSIATSHQIYSLISSIASVCIFNYLFTIPKFSLAAYGTGYPVTFVIMFLTAYITGTMALRYKAQAGESAKIAHRTKILFDTDQLLSKANGKSEIFEATARQIQKLLDRNVVIFENINGKLSEPYFPQVKKSLTVPCSYDFETERTAAEWVLANNHTAGATTDTLSHTHYLYFALRMNEHVYGVIGIDAKDAPLEASAHSILLSILGEAALALENEKNIREKEAAAILAKSEQLRANMLRTISHDLRTPLTSISGNASNLMSNGFYFDEATKQQIYSDIYNDSMWLIDLVENLLYATRIEEGKMSLRTSTELLSDIVEEAIQHISRKLNSHSLSVTYENDLLLVKADAKLIVQVIINIIDNAIKYTPADSSILVTAKEKEELAEICIADNGNGISESDKKQIFEKFYCGNQKTTDNRRSLGLGLYLCKSIVEAHGGTISVMDNLPHGTIFSFTIPLEKRSYYE